MARMSEDELNALADLEIRNAIGYFGGKLAEQRRKATVYYLALPEGDLSPPEVDGRSKVVVPFVRNTIEAMLPQLMVKFTGGDSVVEFEASKPGDEGKAKNCTDYLNYLFWKKNSGHTIAETWMRDALTYKNGIVKIWWDTAVDETKEEYKGLTQVELAQVMEDEEVEVTESAPRPDEEDAKARQQAIQHAQQQAQANPQAAQQIQQQIAQLQAQPPSMLYDITCIRRKKGGKLAIENVPPEEFLISRRAKSIKTASMVGHRTARTLSDLRSMGYPNLDTISSDDTASALNAERMERDQYDDEMGFLSLEDHNATDESQRKVWVNELYMRVDFDGDGISELRKITKVGNTILDNEEVDIAPFADIVCIRRPHSFHGLSIMDLGESTQFTETAILRSQLDNMFLQVNGRYFAVEGQVNLDDLMTSRPGGVVRIKREGAVGRLDQAMGDAQAGMGMLEYMGTFGEAATGWTRNTQGNDAGPLMQATATAANIVANRDDMRVDLIARNFAEGFVELFRQMLKLVCQHQDKKQEVRISGDWVDIDPREWRNQFDVNISVGLGVGGKEQQIQQVMAVIAQQEKVHAIGVATPENIYNASCELAKLAGQKNGDKYFTDPVKNPPPPPPPPAEVIKGQVQSQIEQGKGQVQMQIEQGKGQVQIQLEQAKLQAQLQIAQHKAELDARVAMAEQQAQAAQETQQQQLDAQLEREKASMQSQIEAAKMQHEREIELAKLQAEDGWKKLDAETKVVVAQIQAQASAASAQTSADASVASAKETAKAKTVKPQPTVDLSPIQKTIDDLARKIETPAPDESLGAIKDMVSELHENATAPREVVRDEDGTPIAIKQGTKTRNIKRDGEGRVSGVE